MADYAIYTEEMKKENYTILVPNMLPMHFQMMEPIMKQFGYNAKIMDNYGKHLAEIGLKYVHNDTCYPAILVIGQLIDAINSGNYDPNRVALLMTQTGGGCRASNYIFLLRKALKKAGYGHIPVISFNLSGMEKESAFKITLPMGVRLIQAVLCGDMLMQLRNQCRPYELNPGDTDRLAKAWTDRLTREMEEENMLVSYLKVKKNYRQMVRDFAAIPMNRTEKKVKVGIVGEIFVKFSPLGNNHLDDFLVSEGAEVIMPGFLDFCLYCVYNSIEDYKLYGRGKKTVPIYRLIYRYLLKKRREINRIIEREGTFRPSTDFDHSRERAKDYIGLGVKMGEGWLLTAEMLELAEDGAQGIVCTQPFGCLPNHIVGKGMMKPIKEGNADVNIVAIDYDAGATQINQENRIKMMLANAREVLERQESERKEM
ncbi:MAG: 2-hydroxyacyl-CoA dehydratase [Lachnospiraceae bacterium]|nr:2-hydroxyacyl-CoA dehydratase [Lachnospiraceae bacterium]